MNDSAFTLQGRRALVGGASRGIGRAVAEVLAQQGASVTVLARNEEQLARVVESLATQQGQTHSYLALDYADADAVAAAVAERVQGEGPLHILVNNTGGPAGGPIVEARADEFRDAYERHLIVNHLLMQTLLPGMRAEQYGRIVNIISTSVYEPIPGLGVSNATRWAVASWAKTLSREVAADGITVNNVLPGYTGTDRLDALIATRAKAEGNDPEEVRKRWQEAVPTKRFGKPHEIAYAVAFLASPQAAYINGINLPVDGGRLSSM